MRVWLGRYSELVKPTENGLFSQTHCATTPPYTTIPSMHLYHVGSPRRACDRCHRQKQGCRRTDDNQGGCMRCQRAGVDCISSAIRPRPPQRATSFKSSSLTTPEPASQGTSKDWQILCNFYSAMQSANLGQWPLGLIQVIKLLPTGNGDSCRS